MRRYVVTGSPGAGKTTLIEAQRVRGYAVVAEAATDVVAAGQAAGVRAGRGGPRPFLPPAGVPPPDRQEPA